MSPDMTLSIVMPVYNERNTVHAILDMVLARPEVDEVIIVDDFSSDGTREMFKAMEGREKCRFFYHDTNQGKGAALRTGFAHAAMEIILIQDADLEYDPADYPALLEPIYQGRADVVYGSRFLGGPHRVLYFWHYAANVFLTLLSNMVNNINLTDMEVCYKAFRSEIIKDITIQSDRFGVEPELTAKVARKRIRFYEVPISYHGRTYEEGKKIGWRDGIEALWLILKFAVIK